jgi:carbamoyltransferase
MRILGISAYYHDSAACLLVDGKIVAAAQEERFSRKKHDNRFPLHAVKYCLEEGKLKINEIDAVAYYEKPLVKFERLLETYLAFAPRGLGSFLSAMPVWLKEKLFIKKTLQDELQELDATDFKGKILFTEHHESHAASAFYPSPFEKAAFLTLDGVGEWTTTAVGYGDQNDLHFLKEIRFPHSLGLLYSAFTYYTGFRVNSGEYKLMGLAPYGEPKYANLIKEHLIDIKEDGSFRLNLDYFDYCTGLRMTNAKFDKLFGGPRRAPESPLTQREMDLGRSIQVVTEEVMIKMAASLRKEVDSENLCLAGGVALNCVANGKLLKQNIFKNIWIQPAAGDAGGALGAALAVWHRQLKKPRIINSTDDMQGAYLGPQYSSEFIREFLETRGIPAHGMENEEALADHVADLIDKEKVVGWFQGRMEFGPRALGNRSILGDARSSKMQSTMNLKIKFRESFRPFAPAVLRSHVADYFELDADSPYMLLVAPVKKERCKFPEGGDEKWGIEKLNMIRSDIPAVTHVDYSARIQTIHESTNPRFWKLLKAFEKKTGYALVINTSFNVRGEPPVCTPEDAFRCFMRTEMDHLVLGNFVLNKEEMPEDKKEKSDWKKEFELD